MFKTLLKNICQNNLLPSLSSYSIRFQKRTELQKPKLSNAKKNSVILIKKYVIFPYIDFIEKKCPKTINLYRNFKTGMKRFYKDLKMYVQLRKKMKQYELDSLNREELQLLFTMSIDLKKIIPIILMSIVPFTNYIIVPIAFYFPNKFLTTHFWTMQDKQHFILEDHKKKLRYHVSVIKCMENVVNIVDDPKLLTTLKRILENLNNGIDPIMNDIDNCRKLFSGPPYSLDCIRRKHVNKLLKIHGMSPFTLKNRNRLLQRGLLIKQWDIAIEREGVTKLSVDAIQWALSFRGLNPINMSAQSMQIWLNQWLLISSLTKKENISLLLHCPVFLAYNYKNNYRILYDKQSL